MINKTGSALLLIICVMAMTLFTIATIWRSSVFVYELGLARQEYEQNYWNSTSLMMWAIALCKENFDHFLNYTQHSQQEITLKKWPPIKQLNNQKSDKGLIIFSKKNINSIEIKTTLKKQGKSMIFRGDLERKKNEKDEEVFFIQNWSLE